MFHITFLEEEEGALFCWHIFATGISHFLKQTTYKYRYVTKVWACVHQHSVSGRVTWHSQNAELIGTNSPLWKWDVMIMWARIWNTFNKTIAPIYGRIDYIT